ncbi:MAG TPA: hypothetical protein VJB99_04185 [Patescibacteria group bacterium]|nr:hypothetical protein [Patescibacteria group bacterium]
MLSFPDVSSFTILLSLFWFLFYWIFGGVFFAFVAILRLARMRKVRFSCLFSVLSVVCAVGAAVTGARWAGPSLDLCASAEGIAEFPFLLACGFAGVLSAMLLWTGILLLGGFFFFEISRRKDRSWLASFENKRD